MSTGTRDPEIATQPASEASPAPVTTPDVGSAASQPLPGGAVPVLGHPNGMTRHAALIRGLQAGAGNTVVQRAAAGGDVAAASDPVEAEASRAADLALRQPTVDGPVRPSTPTGGLGRPIPNGPRRQMEAAFGQDFGDVRVHTGRDADRAARGRRALAFTQGTDIYFRGDQTGGGTANRRLLAHELAHVVQQRQAGTTFIGRWGDPEVSEGRHQDARSFVRDALLDSLDGEFRFTELLAHDPALEAYALSEGTVLGAYEGGDRAAVLHAVRILALSLDAVVAEVSLAGSEAPEELGFQEAVWVLSEQLGSPELAELGLPTSFGSNLFVEVLATDLGHYLDVGLNELEAQLERYDPARDGAFGEYAAYAALDVFDGWEPSLSFNFQGDVHTWGDPFGLLELELEAAFATLTRLRVAFAAAQDWSVPDRERAELGRQIGHVARFILVLSPHLAPLDERLERGEEVPRVAEIGIVDGGDRARDIVAHGRTDATSEERALRGLGNRPSLLRQHSIDLARPRFTMGGTQVVTEAEAFPETTDDFVTTAVEDLADRVETQRAELDRLRGELVPEGQYRLETFFRVYAHWFSFFSVAARDSDPVYRLYRDLTDEVFFNPALLLAGPSAHFARAIWSEMVAERIPLGSARNLSVLTETGIIDVARAQEVRGTASAGAGRTGARYHFGELARGGGSADLTASGEASSREEAVRSEIDRAQEDFEAVYRELGTSGDVFGEVARRGLFLSDEDPAFLHLWRGRQSAMEEGDFRGWRSGWSFLLHEQVYNEALELEHHHEHRVMREELSAYLVALSQHYQTVATPHHPTSEGFRIGDSATQADGLESARADATARYVEGTVDTRNPLVEAAHSRIATASAFGDGWGSSAARTVGSETRTLVGDLEEWLDTYFREEENEAAKVMAILRIGREEHDIDAEFLNQFTPEVLAQVVGFAVGMAALTYTLQFLGPVGRLASAAMQGILRRWGINQDVGTILNLGHWLYRCGQTDSFLAARREAFLARPVARELGSSLTSLGTTVATAGLSAVAGVARYRLTDARPQTASELGSHIRRGLPDEDVRAISREVEASARQRLEADRPLGRDGLDELAVIRALDPPAYRQLQQDFGNRVPDVSVNRRIGEPLDAARALDAAMESPHVRHGQGRRTPEEIRATADEAVSVRPEATGGSGRPRASRGAQDAAREGLPAAQPDYLWVHNPQDPSRPHYRRRYRERADGTPVPEMRYDRARRKFVEVRSDIVHEVSYAGPRRSLELSTLRSADETDLARRAHDRLMASFEARQEAITRRDAADVRHEAATDAGSRRVAREELRDARRDVTRASEEMGEWAGVAYVANRHGPDLDMRRWNPSRPSSSGHLAYGGPGRPGTSGTFDQVWRLPQADGSVRWVIIEAKGGSASLGSRNTATGRARQGSPQYRDAIIQAMTTSGDPQARRVARELSRALDRNPASVEYTLVSAPIGSSGGVPTPRDIQHRTFAPTNP